MRTGDPAFFFSAASCSLFIAVASCSTKGKSEPGILRDVPAPNAAALAPLETTTASPWQRSYDAEAVGNLDAALLALNALPQSVQIGYVASLRRGWLLYRLARYDEAVRAYRAANAREPVSVEGRLGVLLPLIALERWKDLESAAEDVIERDPENYSATSRLALALDRMKRHVEAETVYRKLLQRYPGDVDVRSSLAWTLLQMGQRPEAARLFAEVLELAPRNPSALEGWRASSIENRPTL